MRAFIALNFSQEKKDHLCSLQQQIEDKSTAGRFTRRDNLHMTLAFLGDVPPEQFPILRQLMTKCARRTPPLHLSFDRISQLPGKGQETLLYVSCQVSPALTATVRTLHAQLRLAGFSLEDRDFLPHVTLARRCITDTVPEFIPITADFYSMELMLSEHLQGALTYTPIYSAKFHRE